MVTRYAVGLVGSGGRMGSLIEDLIEEMRDFVVVARPQRGSDWSVLEDADIVIDVSNIEASVEVAEYCLEHGKKLIIGTSGWSSDRVSRLRSMASGHADAGILIVPNFAVGSILATRLAAKAASVFPDVEIVEEHHAHKVDAPSGTAVHTREIIDAARPLGSKPIAIHSVRLPGIVAKQITILGAEGEYITITHETTSNTSYRRGLRLAIEAAADLDGVQVGLDRLLGLEE